MIKLLDLWSVELAKLQPTCEVQRFAIERQLASTYKRVYTSETAAKTRLAALDAFHVYNATKPSVDTSNPVLIRAATLLRGWCHLDDWDLGYVDTLLKGGARPGPGSVVDCHSTNGFLKRRNPSFSTQELWNEYKAIHSDDLLLQGHSDAWTTYHQKGAKLSTVPKNQTTDRVITVLPSGDVEVGSGYAAVIAHLLQKRGVYLPNQERQNRRLVRHALRDGLATIDLRRASDSLSYDLLAFLLPSWVVEVVRLCAPGFTAGGRVLLTMGNPLTFPLQTLVFLAIATASMQLCGLEPRVNENIAVYGDDVIVPAIAFRSLCLALEKAGCEINTDKSFAEGPFRESCGLDLYNGVPVRPFAPKGDAGDVRPTTIAYVVNGILAWHYKLGLPCPIFAKLVRYATRHGVPLVPVSAPPNGGVRVPRPSKGARCRNSIVTYACLRVQPVSNRPRLLPSAYGIQAALGGWVVGDDRNPGRKAGILVERVYESVDVLVRQVISVPWDEVNEADKIDYGIVA